MYGPGASLSLLLIVRVYLYSRLHSKLWKKAIVQSDGLP